MHRRPCLDDDGAMPIVIALVLLAVFIGEMAVGAAGNERALVPLGALITRGWSATDWWRVLTFSFLHFNWLHLALNTAGLLWLGRIVQRRGGRRQLLVIFVGSGIASGAAGMLLGPVLPTTGVVVGASGAVCGLLAAALMMTFRHDDDRGVGTALVICLAVVVATSLLPGISLAGHLGGLTAGALLTMPRRLRTAPVRSGDRE
jgi:membrane associated rhomboid family serine protease